MRPWQKTAEILRITLLTLRFPVGYVRWGTLPWGIRGCLVLLAFEPFYTAEVFGGADNRCNAAECLLGLGLFRRILGACGREKALQVKIGVLRKNM